LAEAGPAEGALCWDVEFEPAMECAMGATPTLPSLFSDGPGPAFSAPMLAALSNNAESELPMSAGADACCWDVGPGVAEAAPLGCNGLNR